MPGLVSLLSLGSGHRALPALLAAGAVAVTARSGHRRSPVVGARPARAAGPSRLVLGRWLTGVAVVVVTVLAGPLPVLAAAPVAVAASWVRRSSRRRRTAEDGAAAWCAALVRCAAALRAGSPLDRALLTGAGGSGGPAGDGPGSAAQVLTAAAGVLAAGGDPVALLRTAGGRAGAARQLGAALRLSELTGAAPAALATALAQSAAADQDGAREARLALAGAEATTRMLAALPLAGIPLAAAFGASAPRFLLHATAGPPVLVLAALFEAAGLVWTERLAAGVLR